ncbi:hypothetical protein PgNI_06464 [Pyricularia grisea]|uniref:Uncharacterized protein n=1 Tax=Pyricularia grisea TaxID=148305 RepID=A0A6P8B4S2_PYRGI|nr:hypothetical protein PgNI_06464 [Pyricularia grisea]TLD10336.1 hypothetical protein PgNI_06464 [Pyricularia grisea]
MAFTIMSDTLITGLIAAQTCDKARLPSKQLSSDNSGKKFIKTGMGLRISSPSSDFYAWG